MQLEVTKQKAFASIDWIKQGWKIFTLKPAIFLGMSAIIICSMLVTVVFPQANIIVLLVMPFLSAGFYQITSKVENDEPAEVADIFQYFGKIKEHLIFVKIALFGIVMSIPVAEITAGWQELFAAQQVPDTASILLVVTLIMLNALLTVFAVPYGWVAPNTPLLVILKQSFNAGWVNIIPLTLFGIFTMLFALLSMPILIVGWLIAYSFITISFLQAFLDIFRPVKAEEIKIDDGI